MIESIKHKGLKRLYERNDVSRLPAEHLPKIRMVWGLMTRVQTLQDMNYPGSGLHKLTGDLAGFYAVKISGNYRIIFRYGEGEFKDVVYIDYQ